MSIASSLKIRVNYNYVLSQICHLQITFDFTNNKYHCTKKYCLLY